MHILYYLSIAFKIWMLVDAIKKDASYFWYLVIIFFPFGEWIYFVMEKQLDFSGSSSKIGSSGKIQFFSRRPSIGTLRYNLKNSPSLANKIALAQGLFQKQEYDEAVELCNQILEKDETNKQTLNLLGLCKREMGDYEIASMYFKKLIELQPSYMDYVPWLDFAENLWLSEKKDESVKVLKELVKINPIIRNRTVLAECLIELDKKDEAREMLSEGLEDFMHAPAFLKKTNRQWAYKAKKLLKTIN